MKLIVTGVVAFASFGFVTDFEVEVDEYVPYSFRLDGPGSEPGSGPSRCVQLGRPDQAILEFTLPTSSALIRSVTLLGLTPRHEPRVPIDPPACTGIPLIGLHGLEALDPWQASNTEVPVAYTVNVSTEGLEVDLGGLVTADRCICCGPLHYLTSGNALVGMRAIDLGEEQLRILTGYEV